MTNTTVLFNRGARNQLGCFLRIKCLWEDAGYSQRVPTTYKHMSIRVFRREHDHDHAVMAYGDSGLVPSQLI